MISQGFSLSTISSISSFSTISSDDSFSSDYLRIIEQYKKLVNCLAEGMEQLEAKAQEMEWQRDTAVEHAEMLRQKCTTLEEQVNAKEKKPSRTRMHGLMTTYGARQKVARDDAKRAEKKQKASEAKERRHDKAAALHVQQGVMDGTEIYKGPLSSKSKAQLQDIATALSLSTDGIKIEITKRIKEYLDSAPNLRQDQRFAGLYSSRSRGRGLELNFMQQITQGDISHAAPVAGPSQCWIYYSGI